jgi:predicted enzyme related to lactoylglutathione lyase
MRNPRLLRLSLLFLVAGMLAWVVPVNMSGQSPATNPAAGAFVWYDLVTTQGTLSRDFYERLFGWTFQTTTRNGRPYAIARSGNRPVGGILTVEPGPNAGSQWVSYVIVDDVDKAAEAARTAGSRVVAPPTNIASGRAAVVIDPQGAPIGFGRTTLPAPSVAEATVGQFFWTDYLARDGDAALRFYQRLAGYTVDTPAPLAGGSYLVLRNGRPRAGLFVLPDSVTHIRSHWLPHVRVADPAASATRAKELGGHVLLAPRADVRKGTLAIVSDPMGAPIALQKFPIEEP